MHFRKLFQLLVVGGAVLGANSGCSSPALAQQTKDKKSDAGESASGAAQGSDAGAADAGSGGGVQGW
jgi:hypothetical protein